MILGFLAKENQAIEEALRGYGCDLVLKVPHNRRTAEFFSEQVTRQLSQKVVVNSFEDFGLMLSQLNKVLLWFKDKEIELVFLQRPLQMDNRTYCELLSLIAQGEKQIQSENTKKGMKNSLFIKGRPVLEVELQEQIKALRQQLYPYRKIALELGLSLGTVYKYGH